jgi:hypothetical protein
MRDATYAGSTISPSNQSIVGECAQNAWRIAAKPGRTGGLHRKPKDAFRAKIEQYM